MTAITAAPDVSTAPRPRTGLDRRALAILMPIGPLAIAVLRGILPYKTVDTPAAAAAKIAAHQGAESVVMWLMFAALLTLIPGVIATGMVARRGAPRLGTVGLVLSSAAFMSLFWVISVADMVGLAAARIGMSPATTGRLVTTVGNIHPVGLATGLFVFGHIIGIALLGIALWRGRLVPAWAGLLLAASQFMHLLFAVFVPNHALDGAAWALTAVGFAAAAVAMLRGPGTAQATAPASA
jgi:hypothetical protein